MKKISVKTNVPYEVLIDQNLIQCTGEHIRKFSDAQQALIITDGVVNELYAGVVAKSLMSNGFEVFLFVLSSGEISKSFQSAEKLYSFLVKNEFTRNDIIIALGGGVVGDVAGFVASTYMRGIDFVQIPTTLLAQIDSSVGGKNGVNLSHGKNLVGTIYQPKLVLADIDVLTTLPPKILSDGIAEAIKYGMIKSSELFYKIKNLQLKDFLEDLIFECITIKKDIVEKDEREQNERKLLNFGHTLGHAIERFYNFSGISHGQAISIGMSYAVQSGERLGITKPGTHNELVEVLEKYNLPTSVTCEMEDLITIAKRDKKSAGDFFDVVLVKSIGEGFVKKIAIDDLRKYIGG